MPDREKPGVATVIPPAPLTPPSVAATGPLIPPKRSPGHRGARSSREKANSKKDVDEARRQEARGKILDQVEAESRQDRKEKVDRGCPAWRCSRARPRTDSDRFQKSYARSRFTGRG